MASHWTTGAAIVAALGCAVPALAGEQTLKFRLVTHDISANMLEIADVPGTMVGAHDAIGVALFEDGRVAYKKFVYTDDGTDAAGRFLGYSTYTFENGDSITAKFTGDWTAAGSGGDYQVISGTGAYAGATGTGRFDMVPTAWDGATLFDGSFKLEVPGT